MYVKQQVSDHHGAQSFATGLGKKSTYYIFGDKC